MTLLLIRGVVLWYLASSLMSQVTSKLEIISKFMTQDRLLSTFLSLSLSLSYSQSFSPSHAFFYISLTHLHKQTYGTFVSKDAMMHIIQGNRLDSFFAAFFSFYTFILLLLPQISLVIPHSFVDEEKNGQSLTKQATTCKWSKDQM